MRWNVFGRVYKIGTSKIVSEKKKIMYNAKADLGLLSLFLSGMIIIRIVIILGAHFLLFPLRFSTLFFGVKIYFIIFLLFYMFKLGFCIQAVGQTKLPLVS